MNHNEERFEVGIEFSSVLRAISKQIYDTPYAFIRENLQNSIDASRMQARREGIPVSDSSLRIDINVNGNSVRVQDRGIGMSPDDLRTLFWTIGASGKRNEEARAAGCVGMFGIGGFANLGVCETLIVTSQSEDGSGQRTELSRMDIESAIGLPRFRQQPSDQASPRGTIVEGILHTPAEAEELRQYVHEIVKFCREPIYFDDQVISGEQLKPRPLLQSPGSSQTWSHNGISILGTLYETSGRVLAVTLEGLSSSGNESNLSGEIIFEGHGIEVLKQGFKLCSTTVATKIGVSGFIDCDLLAPTAGRDSLDAQSNTLVANIIAALEHAAVLAVLESSELIEQHTRIFQYIRAHGLVGHMGKVTVHSADGQQFTLDEVRSRAEKGSQIYLATSSNATLSDILQTRGHIVVHLPGDNHKAAAIQEYLASIGAIHLSGHVECKEEYTDLSRFEKAFLSELAETIADVYQVQEVSLIPGSLTEDIPVFVANSALDTRAPLRIYLDSRHPEVKKLAQLGMTSLFRSMVSAFCREYLGPALRSRSPKFFGSGAVNLDWLAAHRSEAWILLTGDIAVVDRSVRHQVVTVSDIHVVTTSPESGSPPLYAEERGTQPKLVKIESGEEFRDLEGYYLRVPNSASEAYGDVIVNGDDRGAVWTGNKILLVASDAISTAFQFEIRLDRLLVASGGGSLSQGAVVVDRRIQQLFSGLYFPIPCELEEYLVPVGDQEIRIEVRSDLLDFAGARSWEAREKLE